ncbi:TetR/AcrR family transcriptional regulator [Paenibacillus rhizoplanae]
MGETEDKIRTPQQERSIRTKEAIIRAAMQLFSDKGFYQTNTKEIAAAAGVSTGSFYSYFCG